VNGFLFYSGLYIKFAPIFLSEFECLILGRCVLPLSLLKICECFVSESFSSEVIIGQTLGYS
jgi:hypothetical protein